MAAVVNRRYQHGQTQEADAAANQRRQIEQQFAADIQALHEKSADDAIGLIFAEAEAARQAGVDEVSIQEWVNAQVTAENDKTFAEHDAAVKDWSEKAAEWELASADEATREKARLDAWYLGEKQAIEQDERLGAADKAAFLASLDQARADKSLEITRNAAEERADIERQAAEELADLLPETDERVWDLKFAQAEESYEKLRKAAEASGVDVAAIDEAYMIQFDRIMEEKTLATGDFFDGVAIGYQRMLREEESWARTGYGLIEEFASSSRAAISDGLFAAMKGEMDSFEDAWGSFMDGMLRAFTDVVAEMATRNIVKAAGIGVEWVLNQLHTGAVKLKEDELVAKLQKGEMVIPADQAETIRQVAGDGSSVGSGISSADFFDRVTGMVQLGGNVGQYALDKAFGIPGVTAAKGANLGRAYGALASAGINAWGVYDQVQTWGRTMAELGKRQGFGITQEAIDKVALNQALATGVWSLAGSALGYFSDLALEQLGYGAYAVPGRIVGTAAGALLGGPLGAIVGTAAAPLVSVALEGLADWMDLRPDETIQDALDDAFGFDSAAVYSNVLDHVDTVNFGPLGGPTVEYGIMRANGLANELFRMEELPQVVAAFHKTMMERAAATAGERQLERTISNIHTFGWDYTGPGWESGDETRVGGQAAAMARDISSGQTSPDWYGDASKDAARDWFGDNPGARTPDSFKAGLSETDSARGVGLGEWGEPDDSWDEDAPYADDKTDTTGQQGTTPEGGYSAGGAVDRLFQIPGMSPPAGDDGFAGLAYGEIVLTREQAARLRAMGALPGYAKGSGSDRGDPTYVLGDDTLPAWAKHFSDLDRALEALTANGIHLTQEGLRALMDQVDDNASSYKEYVKALKEGTDLTDKEKVNNDLAQREAQALADITGRYEGLNDILMEQAKLAADTAKYEEIKAAEEAGWTKEQLKRLEEVQHLEDEAVKAQIDGDLELRSLRLKGHDIEADRLEQERSKQEALAQAIADGYSADQVAQLADMIDAEVAKGLADAAASFAADMGSRELTASGQTGEAERQGRARDQADELEAAVSQFGEGSAEVARLLAVQTAENKALAESMAKSIDLYIAQVTGNEEGAAWMQLQEEHAQRWQEAIAAGVSDDVLGRLEEAMQLENDKFAIEQQHAAEIAALETKERTESLQVRMLRAQGLDGEADALALQMEQERELLEARQAGYTEEELALLAQVQAAEKLQAAAEGVADAVEDTTRAITEWDEERARIARALQAAKTGQSTEAYDYEYQVRSDQRNNVDRWSESIVNTQAALDRALTDGTSAENIANIRNTLASFIANREAEAEILERMDIVYASLLAEREKEFRSLDIRELAARGEDAAAEYAQKFADMQDEMDEAALKFDDEYTARLREVQALELLQWAQDKQADTIADLTDAYRDAADDLTDTIRDLTYSEDLSTLDPGEKLAKLQAEFDALSAKALAGDAEAMAQLGGLSQEYLSARRGYYGSSGGYASEYERVMGILSTAQTMAETYAKNPLTSEVYEKMSEAQLDELRAMSGYMETIASQDQLSQWQQLLQAMGVPGYASGGLVTSVARIPWLTPVGDDGVIGARIGEQMLTTDQLANLSPARILDLSAPIGSAKGTVGGDASKEVVAAVNKLTAQFTSYRQQQADEQKEIRAQNTALIRENKELRLKAQRQAAK